MAIEPTTLQPTLEAQLAAVEEARLQARTELDAMVQAASAADTTSAQSAPDYSLHEVSGVGRYAVPRFTGWQALLKILHDPAANIDFSAKSYPVFDAVLGDHFQSPYLLDPLDDHFESYRGLRDNIAAVRNFLMESYYVNTPPGMTPEKAKTALSEIAGFVGDGLYNNWRFLSVVPNHDPTKPFISLSEASAGNGAGAQYIYEKILEMQRQSNWMRPFSAILEFFGGKAAPDWMLPDARATHFTDLYAQDLAPTVLSGAPTLEEVNAAIARSNKIEGQRQALLDQLLISNAATDLSALGDQLIHTAEHMDGVATLSEPVRHDAVEIAKDILRKLKISIGDLNILDGLKMKPSDDIAAVGAIKGVAGVYERLLAWGRKIDGSIMQQPPIIAAIQAIGQLGYVAKLEALRMAQTAHNSAMAQKLAEQLSRMNPAFANGSNETIGSLLDKVERGIDTVLNRIQEISGPGAKVGHSPTKELGSYMGSAPIAGMSMQVGSDGTQNRDSLGKRNAAMLQAEEAAARATAQRIQSQNAARDRAQGTSSASTAPSRAATGRQAVQQARNAQGRPASAPTSTTTPPAAMNAAQRQQALRTNALRTHASHEAEEHHLHDLQVQQQLQQALRQVNLKQMQKSVSTAGLTNAPVTTGRAAYDKMMAARTGTPAPKAATPADKAVENPYAVQPPHGPNKGGRGF